MRLKNVPSSSLEGEQVRVGRTYNVPKFLRIGASKLTSSLDWTNSANSSTEVYRTSLPKNFGDSCDPLMKIILLSIGY